MKPDDIPQDVWDYAEIALKFVPSGDDSAQIDSIARAILAERERCAKVAEQHFTHESVVKTRKGSPCTAEAAVIYAAVEIAAAIRKGGE